MKNLCLIKFIGTNLDKLNIESSKAKKNLEENTNNLIILGPSLSNIPKIYNKYYIQIIIKYKKINEIYNSIDFLNNKYKSLDIVFDVDFNPKSM